MSNENKAQSTGGKALRIAFIQGVSVIEERIVSGRDPISVGTGDKNTFTLASSDLPKMMTLFEVKDGQYQLALTEAMSGSLDENNSKTDFAALRAKSTAAAGVWRIPVSENCKGTIRLSSDITVLFHFVTAPKEAPIPVIPADLRGGIIRAFEPIFTAVLTASFLVHLVLGLYIKVTNPPEHSELEELKELVERIQPPKAEVKPIELPKPAGNDPTAAGNAQPEEPTKPTKGSGGGDGGGGGGGKAKGKGKGGGGSGGAGDLNAIREGIAGKGILQLIGGRGGGGGGGAVGSVFGAGGGINDDIGNALQGTAGVGVAGGSGGGGGVTRRGTGGGGGGGDGSGGDGGGALGIGDLNTGGGGGGGGKVDTGEKKATKVVARVRADDIEAIDGKIDQKSVAATIRRRQDGFQACYETELKANSKLQGKLVVEFTIVDGGKVSSARVVKDGLNSAGVSRCVVDLLKRLRFPSPADGEVTISNTFVFQPGG